MKHLATLLKLRRLNWQTLRRAIRYLRRHGWVALLHRASENHVMPARPWSDETMYSRWVIRHEPSLRVLQRQRLSPISIDRFLLFVPLEGPADALRATLGSVLAQTYSGWQLCLTIHDSTTTTLLMLAEAYCQDYENVISWHLNKEKCPAAEDARWVSSVLPGDTLAPFALYELAQSIQADSAIDALYADEDTLGEDGKTRQHPIFKPDWSPDTLRSCNYIGHPLVVSRNLFSDVVALAAMGDAHSYELALRTAEATGTITHIPMVLYHRSSSFPIAETSSEVEFLADHLRRIGLVGSASHGSLQNTFAIDYALNSEPLISILIPNRDNAAVLARCVESILRSSYVNFEILIIENNSVQAETLALYERLAANPSIRILTHTQPFNFSRINNFAVAHAQGESLVFLNNDTEALRPDWLQRMLMYAQRPDIGAVGAKLYYPDGTIQHAGIVLGIGGVAGHGHKNFVHDSDGYCGRLKIVQNVGAVTAACLMMRKDVFYQVGGFDESLAVAFNDVDLCLRIRAAGYRIVWTPDAQLHHYESKTRGYEDTPQKRRRFRREINTIHRKWGNKLHDPYYSPNLTLDEEDFSLGY